MTATETGEAGRDSKRRAANIKKLAAMMAKMDLSASDIAGKSSRKPGKKAGKQSKAGTKSKVGPKKRTKGAPRQKITSEVKAHQWMGRGRMPPVFKHFV